MDETQTIAFPAWSPTERSSFADAVHRLFRDGFLWRDDARDRKAFAFILRHESAVRDYLALAGWQLHHHERQHILQIVHAEGAHRRRLGREATIWFLVLRLIYAEQREAKALDRLSLFPAVTIGDVYARYAGYFPGKTVRKKQSLADALRLFEGAKLLRAAGSAPLRPADGEQILELLPAFEIVLPSSRAAEVAQRLGALTATGTDGDGQDNGHDDDAGGEA